MRHDASQRAKGIASMVDSPAGEVPPANRQAAWFEAILFDFDGVIVDSEPIHLAGLQQVLSPLGVELSRENYYARYLGLNDRDCLEAVARHTGIALAVDATERLIAAKTRFVQSVFAREVRALPGAVEFIRDAHARGIPLAICSGALRDEIRLAAGTIGVLDYFQVIVPAEDVICGKPDPAGYRLALERLSACHGRPLDARRTLVVEDAPAGVEAALASGMRVLAVATSFDAGLLGRAHRVVHSLADVSIERLTEEVWG